MSGANENILSDEEIKQNLVAIYNEIKAKNLRYEQIMKKYGIGQYAILDLNSMTLVEFEKLLNKISDIKSDIQNGYKARKISADLGCGASIIGYIAQSTCENYKKKSRKDEQFVVLCKKMETIWKQYKRGETIENLSHQYSMDKQDLESLLNNFDSSLKDKQLYYKNLKRIIAPEEKKSKLKEKFNFDDDTVAYIVDGKEIGTTKNEREVELGEQ